MTLGELKRILSEFPAAFDDTVVIRAKDDEGNGFHQIGDVVPYLTSQPVNSHEIEYLHEAGSEEEDESDQPVIVIW